MTTNLSCEENILGEFFSISSTLSLSLNGVDGTSFKKAISDTCVGVKKVRLASLYINSCILWNNADV